MKKNLIIIIVITILGIILITNVLFTVSETEQAIITQFGEPVRSAIKTAGLKVKIPFIQKVHYFEKRIMEWDGESSQIPTKDKKFILVDSFVRWRINDPLLFYQTNRTISYAYTRLDDIIDGVTRDIITQNDLFEIVRSSNRKLEFSSDYDMETLEDIQFATINVGREQIAEDIYHTSLPVLLEYGIEVIDVKIKRINYIDSVRKQVYDRMISERKKIAERYRSAGQGRAAEINGKLQRDLKEIESAAYKEAQTIIGQADAEAINIYANAYNRDPDFYGFMRTLEAYSKTMNEKNTLILTTDSDLLKYIKRINAR